MGLRIRTRLLVLAVLPAGVSGVFASANVTEANQRAEVASQLVPATEHLAAINEAHAAILAERFGGLGEVVLRGMGIPPELTVQFVNFDLRAIVEDARTSLDDALARVPPTLLAPGVRDTLAEARALVDEGSSDAAAVAELLFSVEESLRTARGVAAREAEDLAGRMDDRGELDEHVRAMSAYGLLMSAATDETTSLGETIFPETAIGVSRVQLAEAMARVDFAEELLTATLDGELYGVWERLSTGPEATAYVTARQDELPVALAAPVQDLSERVQAGLDLERVARLARLVALGMDRSEAWSGFAVSLARVIESEASGVEAQAYDDARRATVLAIAYSALSLLLGGLTALSITRPLRRLEDRARKVRDGALDLPPLGRRGPADVAHVAQAIDELAGSLDLVTDQVAALSAGRLDDDCLRAEVPGRLGEVLQGSVARLASATEALQRSESRAKAVVEHAGAAMWELTEDGLVVGANRAAEQLVGMPDEQMVGKPLAGALLDTTPGSPVAFVRGDGARRRELALMWGDVEVDGNRLITVVGRDISEARRFERRLAYQARHDSLTGLPNRLAVTEHLNGLPSEQQVAVLFVDLDGFKRINDTYGHTIGDRLLSVVSARLGSFADDRRMLARLGGDEFVLVVQDVDEQEARELGELLVAAVRAPIILDGQRLVVGASVGVMVDTGRGTSDLLRDADQAMYRAKKLGKGRVEVFTVQLARESEARREVERELGRAVDNGELRVHLQPVVALGTSRPWGAEALVRWQHPERGLLPAGAFVPAAEGGPLVVDIDRFVLRSVCDMLARWSMAPPETGLPDLSIAVNVSGRHLTEGSVVDDVLNALADTGAPASRLQLEITESHLLADLRKAKAELQLLVDRGMSVACDDFGTGFASLTYLRELPVSTMKIDRSFVQALPGEGDLVRVLQSLADLLDLDVVAEGVETAEQLDWLRSVGCDYAQGYHLAKPMPPEEAEAWMVGRWWTTLPFGRRS